MVKTLTLSLDAREPHGRKADHTEQKIKVAKKTRLPPIFDLSLLATQKKASGTQTEHRSLEVKLQNTVCTTQEQSL